MNGHPPHEGAAAQPPPEPQKFETLDEMREALEEGAYLFLLLRIGDTARGGETTGGLVSITDVVPLLSEIEEPYGGGQYIVAALGPADPLGQWTAVCLVDIEGEPVVHRMNLVLPPETPVDVLQIPGLRHILNSLLAAQNGLDFGEYEEVPPEEPRVAIPAAEEPSRCPPRGPLAAGMALGAGMTAYGAGAFLSDMMQLLGGVGHGMDRGLSTLAPLFAQFAQSAMAPPYAAVHPGMAVPSNMPPMPDMPDMPAGPPEPPSEGASSPPVDDASEAPDEQEVQGAPQGEPEEPPASPEPPEGVS